MTSVIIAIYVGVVGTGLLVLYLAVRVIRAAWHPGPSFEAQNKALEAEIEVVKVQRETEMLRNVAVDAQKIADDALKAASAWKERYEEINLRYTGASRSTEGNVMSQAPVEALQLMLSPPEAWILAAALSTGIVPPGTEDVKWFRARLGILGEVQEYSRTDAGREVLARLLAKVFTMIKHLEGKASP
jgi:hypothetical protein